MTSLPCFVVKAGLTWKCDVCGKLAGGPLGFLQVCPRLHDPRGAEPASQASTAAENTPDGGSS